MKGLSLFLFAVWASCLHAQLSHEWHLFQDFIRRYNKPYANDSEDFESRFSAFKVEICLRCTRPIAIYTTACGTYL